MKWQRQLDPLYGVADWDDFNQGLAVRTWAPAEPHKRVPIDVLRRALATVETTSFWEVQAAHLIVTLLFTFARSETPMPRNFTGDDSFDSSKHLTVGDVQLVREGGRLVLKVRLKRIKQDPRMERTEAAGDADGVTLAWGWH